MMVALGGVSRGGKGPPGLGKNQAGGVGNRSRPQRLFTVIKNPGTVLGLMLETGNSPKKRDNSRYKRV